MSPQRKEFWSRLQHSAEVVVASRDAEQLLGVRDGFRRYLDGLGGSPTLAVRQAPAGGEAPGAWVRADTTLAAATRQAQHLRAESENRMAFCVGTGEGLETLEVDGSSRDFVQCWVVVASDIGTASGGSGPIEIPERFIQSLDLEGPVKVPGTRRRGGMIGSLTGGLESRREAFALATFHALSSLFYGRVEPQRGPRRWLG